MSPVVIVVFRPDLKDFIPVLVVTPEDTIVKSLNDLTQALKEQRNTKGTIEYEALKKLDELLSGIPTKPITEETTRRVTFDAKTKPPAEQQYNQNNPQVVMTMQKRIQDITPAPRVRDIMPAPRVQTAIIEKPIPKTLRQETTIPQQKLQDKIDELRITRLRLARRTHMDLRSQQQ